MDIKRVNNDVNGNPRYVVHFLGLITERDEAEAPMDITRIEWLKNRALYWARKVGGRVYRGKDFGGGIVFTSYNLEADLKLIERAQKVEGYL